MNDRWMLRGTNFVNCNCAYGCPCQFGSPTTHGNCRAAGANHIREGFFNDIRLDGLNIVLLIEWPGEIADGNGREQFLIDERANSAQREALVKIMSGQATQPGATHFYVFNSTMREVLDPIYTPLECEIDVAARKARIRAPGLLELEGKPLVDRFSGGDVQVAIELPNGFEYTRAEVADGKTRTSGAAGIALELDGTHGHFSELHMTQDGVVR